MKLRLACILICLFAYGVGNTAPFCQVRHYDEYDGLSERRVKQIVQDKDGLLWFATWNGLNRFDGYKFERIRPRIDDEARAFSDRFGDLKPTSDGNLWCRVDEKLLLFDVKDHRFHDINSKLERKFGKRIEIKQLLISADGHTVIKCADKCYITMIDTIPVESAQMSQTKPKFKYISPGNRKLGDIGRYRHDDLIYSRRDSTGAVWIITLDGEVLYAPSRESELLKIATIDPHGAPFSYATTDSRNNIWLRSGHGAYCLTIGHRPYSIIPQARPSIVRAFFHDAAGNIWISNSDTNSVACYSDPYQSPRYLDRQGRLHDEYVAFGSKIYCISGSHDGTLWLGSKPDGLFRLTPKGSTGFNIENFTHGHLSPIDTPADNDIYDIAFDSQGRMWIATMHGGIDCIPNPNAPIIKFTHLADHSDYPSGARRVRRLTIVGDSIMLAATTGGLLVFRLPAKNDFDNLSFKLHVSEPGRESSLGNIAVMQALADAQGRIFVATESDGVNMLRPDTSPMDDNAEFRHFNTRAGIPNDVAYALATDEKSANIWVVSSNMLYSLNPDTNESASYSASYRDNDMHFSDAKPLNIGGNRLLIGLENGAIAINLDKLSINKKQPAPIAFTSVSLQNRPDSLISIHTDKLTLLPHERNITVRFASLDYGQVESIRYSFSLDNDNGWTDLGLTRSVTFLDLSPGEHMLRVRSSDSSGNWLDNERTLTITVTPTFWETPLAYIIYAILCLSIITAITWTVVYIRRIKSKQNELLDAYLKLVNKDTPGTRFETTDAKGNKSARLNEADETFMQRVLDFVNLNISNPDVSIDDMASATATSRSSLNRKMKSLLGVTPADFLKESRINRAATLLSETDLPIKDIALECGFSDINYFSKCFKAARKTTPTTFRKDAKGDNSAIMR